MGKRLSLELGQRVVNSGTDFLELRQIYPCLAVLLYFLSDFPTSEIKYTDLEFQDKAPINMFAATGEREA